VEALGLLELMACAATLGNPDLRLALLWLLLENGQIPYCM
jgi:hypothetical protein